MRSLSQLIGTAALVLLSVSRTTPCTAADNELPLTDKTLVVWVSPANLDQTGG